MNNLIDLLQHQGLVWQGSLTVPVKETIATGYDELDQRLDGGFPKGVTEIQSVNGIGELRLLLPALKASLLEQRLIVFIAPQGVLSSQALAAQGLELNNIIVVYPATQDDSLWAAEECLRSGACHSVVMWTHKALEIHQVKRLQVASEVGCSRQFILRINKTESLSLPLNLSMSLQPHSQGLLAKINKRRCGWSSENFVINMANHWPALTLGGTPDNLVHFPQVKVS